MTNQPHSPWLQEALVQFEKERTRFANNARFDFLDLTMSRPFEYYPKINSENKKNKKAMILIHGFLGTPYFMKYLAEAFRDQGFYCYAPRLPGHGICQEAMRCLDLSQILKNLMAQIQEIQTQFEEIYLCGFSFGGLLSTLLVQEFQDRPELKIRIKSLILFAPSFGITPLSKLIPFLTTLGFGNILHPSAANMNGIKNPAMYYWYPLCAVLPIIKGIQQLKSHLQKPDHASKNIPTFIVSSAEDAVVQLAPTLDFFESNSHPDSRLYLYSQKKYKFKLNSKITLINPEDLGPPILNLSHVSLLMPPEDPTFGQNSPQYQTLLKNKKKIFLGEKLSKFSFTKNLYRLFYNPDFKSLTQALLNFLK